MVLTGSFMAAEPEEVAESESGGFKNDRRLSLNGTTGSFRKYLAANSAFLILSFASHSARALANAAALADSILVRSSKSFCAISVLLHSWTGHS